MKVIQLMLAENQTEKKIKVRMKEEDKKIILGILKKDFKIIHEREVKY